MAFLLTILFLIAAIGLAYLIWIIRAALKRQWRKLIILVSIPAVAFGLLCLWGWTSHRFEYARYLEGLFDTKVVLGPVIYSYDSERAFNGDGYSIAVYKLPQSIRDRFTSPDSHLFTEFPKRPDYRSHWKTVFWKQAPFDDSLSTFLDFALSTYDADRAEGLGDQFDAIKTALRKRTTFYALFYNDPGKYVGDIDLFIIDLEADRLYTINHNT